MGQEVVGTMHFPWIGPLLSKIEDKIMQIREHPGGKSSDRQNCFFGWIFAKNGWNFRNHKKWFPIDDVGIILCGIYGFYSEIMKFLQLLQKWLIFGTFLQKMAEILEIVRNGFLWLMLASFYAVCMTFIQKSWNFYNFCKNGLFLVRFCKKWLKF